MSQSRWLQGLNPEQREAVLHDHGPMLILAGAGSGKTTVLVSRTGRLIEERIAPASGILVLTFTNKAARELRHRVAAKVGPKGDDLWSGTFHSFGLFLLKRHWEEAGLNPRFSIVDSSDCVSILKELMKETKISGKDRFDVDRLLNEVNDFRGGTGQRHRARDEYSELAEMLAPKFEKRLELLGVVDFEALLLKPLQLFKEHPAILEQARKQFQHVMVDEFQDTNTLQMKLIHMLADGHRNVCVVGDDDQSIYGWRGAEVANILNFPSSFKGAKVVKLERNYRSSPAIVNLANEVIAKNTTRHGKILKPESSAEPLPPELFILENEDEEAEFVAQELKRAHDLGYKWKELAVLYRSNTQGGFIESALRRHRIDYTISGGTSIFDRKEAKDVLSYLRSALTPNDVAFRRILNVPSRGIGDTTLEKLVQHSKTRKCGFIQAARQWREAGVHDKAGESIESLQNLLRDLLPRLLDTSAPGTIGDRLVEYFTAIGYRAEVMASASGQKPGSAEKRWAVVEIVARILESFIAKRKRDRDSILDFLEAMTLRDDDKDDAAEEKVSLMTLHASKGLEFPYVILAGIEEDLLPHGSLGSNIDEERRLFYVGITRAKQRLVLSRCQTRKRHGQQKAVAPSRFLLDLPGGLFKEFHGAFRPVTAGERENLVGGLLAGLSSRPKPKKI